MFHRIFLLLTLTIPIFAQDGGQLYTLYCSACHAPDGKGATGGTFPPLAASPWLAGDPDRAVKVVLHGLHGPVDVLGKTYNLEMPPQGAMLPDDQIAAILTHVRASWGNAASPVTADAVNTIRTATADRKTAWTAPEILKLHPLPLEKTALSGLTSQVYKGDWKHLPDFKALKAENIEEEHDGIISLTDSPHKENFAMVWEGTLNIPADGEYYFSLDCDDAGRLIIDDEIYTEVHGIGPLDGSRVQRSINELKKGPHSFRAEYVQNGGNQGIAIGWRPKSQNHWNWLTESSGPATKERESLIIAPTDGRPVIYRNFIEGATSRAIGVGFPGGLNLAYSADHLAPALIWTGTFMDGAQKWLARGTDKSSPAGEKVITLATARTLPTAARFRGYKLESDGSPNFSIQVGKQILRDHWSVSPPQTVSRMPYLIRTLYLDGPGPAIDLVISDHPVDAQIDIQNVEGGTLKAVNGRTTLQVPPKGAVTLTYRWK